MKGREEEENRINNQILERIKDRPDYLTEYFYYIDNKTALTKRNYINKVLAFLDYMKRSTIYDPEDIESFKKMKPAFFSRYLGNLEGKDETRAQHYYGLSNFFSFLFENDYIEKNPFDKIKPAKATTQNEITVLTPEEINTIINNIKNPRLKNATGRRYSKKLMKQNILIVKLALETGMRQRSIREIHLEDIDLDEMKISIVQKGSKIHEVYFGDNLKQSIEEWLIDRKKILDETNEVDDGSLFLSGKGKKIPETYITNMFIWATEGIDKNITPHKLRSTFATTVYEKTGDIYLTANMLGHSGIKNVTRYARPNIRKQREMTSLLDNLLIK